jgi:hypothetical protein
MQHAQNESSPLETNYFFTEAMRPPRSSLFSSAFAFPCPLAKVAAPPLQPGTQGARGSGNKQIRSQLGLRLQLEALWVHAALAQRVRHREGHGDGFTVGAEGRQARQCGKQGVAEAASRIPASSSGH